MTNFLTPPSPPSSAKVSNRIRKHVTNFKNHPIPFHVDVINVWSLTTLNQHIHLILKLLLPQDLIQNVTLISIKLQVNKQRGLGGTGDQTILSLPENCPNSKFFLVRIYLYSD